MADPPMTIKGNMAFTLLISGTTVAGVRAVATVNKPPRSPMMRLSVDMVPGDSCKSLPSKVPEIDIMCVFCVHFGGKVIIFL